MKNRWQFYIIVVMLAAVVILAGMWMVLYFTQGQSTATVITYIIGVLISIIAITRSTAGVSEILNSLAELLKNLLQ